MFVLSLEIGWGTEKFVPDPKERKQMVKRAFQLFSAAAVMYLLTATTEDHPRASAGAQCFFLHLPSQVRFYAHTYTTSHKHM